MTRATHPGTTLAVEIAIARIAAGLSWLFGRTLQLIDDSDLRCSDGI